VCASAAPRDELSEAQRPAELNASGAVLDKVIRQVTQALIDNAKGIDEMDTKVVGWGSLHTVDMRTSTHHLWLKAQPLHCCPLITHKPTAH
jgi:hypothetical protein